MSRDNTFNGNAPPPDSERKLWLDYIAKLNDRSTQTSRESGATNWVLLGVAAAIVYKSVPQLPLLLPIAGVLKSAVIILLLEINALILLGIAILYLLGFCIGSMETRLMPTTGARVQQIGFWCLVGAFIALAISGVWVAIAVGARPTWVRWVVAGFGVWWALNIGSSLKKKLRTSQKAKKLGAPVPRFLGSIIDLDSGALIVSVSAVHALLGLIPLAALFAYLRTLSHSQAGWVIPLTAATHSLVLLVVVAVLLVRLFQQVHSSAFLKLERAILLENLTPVEIRSRFVTELLGTGVGEWLGEIINGIKSAQAKLKACADSVRERVPEVAAIDSQYSLERKGRAKKLLDELRAGISEYQASVRTLQFQLSEYSKFAASKEETEMLKRMSEDLQTWLVEVKAHAASTGDLVKTLTSF